MIARAQSFPIRNMISLICAGSFVLIAFYRNCKHSRPIDFSNDNQLRLHIAVNVLMLAGVERLCDMRTLNDVTLCFSFNKNEMECSFV